MSVTTETRSYDEAQIRREITDWSSALCARDLDRLMSHYASDVTLFDLKPPFQVRGAAALRQMWEACLPCFPASFDTETRDLKVVVSGDVAFGHSLFRVTGAAKDHPVMQTWLRATSCYKRQHGRWQIVHEHVSLPFHPETSKAAFAIEL